MRTLTIKLEIPYIKNVTTTSDALHVDLNDGRSIDIPLAWYPRLLHSTENERKHWRLIGKGSGIHWEDIDEDISIEGLLAGRRSKESQISLQKWLDKRQAQQIS